MSETTMKQVADALAGVGITGVLFEEQSDGNMVVVLNRVWQDGDVLAPFPDDNPDDPEG